MQPYYQVLFSTHNIENTEFKHKRAYRKLEKNSALHGLVYSNHFYPNSQVQKQNGTIIQPPTIPNLIHTNTTCNHKKHGGNQTISGWKQQAEMRTARTTKQYFGMLITCSGIDEGKGKNGIPFDTFGPQTDVEKFKNNAFQCWNLIIELLLFLEWRLETVEMAEVMVYGRCNRNP